MAKINIPIDLTDEEILSAFVKHFECDGAILIYLDRTQEHGFSKWKNASGQAWANDVFHVLQNESRIICMGKRAKKIFRKGSLQNSHA